MDPFHDQTFVKMRQKGNYADKNANHGEMGLQNITASPRYGLSRTDEG